MLRGQGGGEPARYSKVEDNRDLVVGRRRDRNRTGRYDERLGDLTEAARGVARGRREMFLLALKGDGKRGEEGWLSCSKGERITRRSHSEHELAGEGIRGTVSRERGR